MLAGPAGQQTATHLSIAGVSAAVVDPNAKSTCYKEYVVGTEYELFPRLNVGIRYVHRNLARVLEDVTPYPLVAADLGLSGATSVDYILTNPGADTPTAGNLGASFEEPVHTYNAVEITGDKRFGGNWSLHASYRWSQLRGTVEGFYRDDNGQSDPGISSLYDFPSNDPSYTAIGGQRLFKSKCQRCHGVSGTGGGPDADPDHPPSDLTDATRAARNPDGVMFYKIWNGRVRPKMPAFKTDVSGEDVWTVIQYIKTLRKPVASAGALPQ